MKKILLTLALLSAGCTTHIKAATTLKSTAHLNQILTNNKGAALTNISITNAYLSVPPQRVDKLMKAGYQQTLTTAQVNLLLSQEQTNGAKGALALQISDLSSVPGQHPFLQTIDLSGLTFNDSGTLYFTINFTCANLQYSFVSSGPAGGNNTS
jgi:hypothetical protein